MYYSPCGSTLPPVCFACLVWVAPDLWLPWHHPSAPSEMIRRSRFLIQSESESDSSTCQLKPFLVFFLLFFFWNVIHLYPHDTEKESWSRIWSWSHLSHACQQYFYELTWFRGACTNRTPALTLIRLRQRIFSLEKFLHFMAIIRQAKV